MAPEETIICTYTELLRGREHLMQVYVRMRPVRIRERGLAGDDHCLEHVPPASVRFRGTGTSCDSPQACRERKFTFDAVLGCQATQEDVFNGTFSAAVCFER